MFVSKAYDRRAGLTVVALCSFAAASFASPALAKPHQSSRNAYSQQNSKSKHARQVAFAASSENFGGGFDSGVGSNLAHSGQARSGKARSSQVRSSQASYSGNSNIIAEARRYLGGGNPTGRARLWCARFMNMVLERSGHRGTGSDMARSFAHYGQQVSGPQIGAIAVLSRGRSGGHVGIVTGVDAGGNPIIISGNHNDRVAEAAYPRGRVLSYVVPTS